MNILHLDSSVTGDKSTSRKLSKAAAEQVKKANPGAEYTYRDLVVEPLRHYTAVLRTHGAEASNLDKEQAHELQTGEKILAEFMAADTVLIGAPMYNFSIPSQLKAWIDLICVAGTTFRYTEKGPEGQCGGKKVVILSASGGLYGPGSPFAHFNHQTVYLEHMFGFLGVKDITVISAGGLSLGAEKAGAAIAAAEAEISKLQ